MRGDVPKSAGEIRKLDRFSPHARGCSVIGPSPYHHKPVFPACAGMFRFQQKLSSCKERFPRMRGDVPNWLEAVGVELSVFPACAGMFLRGMMKRLGSRCFPRMRGDVPWVVDFPTLGDLFSPHARGCSEAKRVASSRVCVFPACAGMFRRTTATRLPSSRFPRMRGDVPHHPDVVYCDIRFSPHARGCSSAMMGNKND